ncbi:MAG: CDP-alcohol phosphatidyltransferase family protein [Ruminococcus sp.]
MDNNEKWSFKPKDLITIPNILTYIRIILIVPFVYYFLIENYIPAVICIGVSGLTDCFDGMIARKFNQVTSLGKILDPIADKFTLLAVVICMVIYVPIVLPVLVVLLLKDVLMLLGGMDLVNKGITPPAAKWYGKVGTVVFYLSVFTIIFLKAVFGFENFALDVSLLSVTAITMLFALYQYGKIYFQLIKEHNGKVKSKENEESK